MAHKKHSKVKNKKHEISSVMKTLTKRKLLLLYFYQPT